MNSNKNIIDEISNQLDQYFSKEESTRFYKLLKESERKAEQLYDISDNDEKQINKKLVSGKNIRDQIDRLLTYSEQRISIENYIKIALSIVQLLINYGELELAREITEDLMERFIADDSVLIAETYLYQSKIEWNQGHWKESNTLCKKSLTIFNKLNNDEGMAKCENMFGTILGEKGEIQKAREHFLRGLDFIKYKQCDSLKGMLNSNLGIISNILGRDSESKSYYVRALNYYSKIDEPRNLARLNHNIGMFYMKKHQYNLALKYFNDSIGISLDKGYLSNCAISFVGKAYAYAQMNQQELSDAFAEKALEISYRINDRLSIAEVYRVKGLIQKALNNQTLSEEYLENSIRLNEDFDNKVNSAEVSLDLSKLYAESNESEKSDQLLKEVIKYYNKIKAKEVLINLQPGEL